MEFADQDAAVSPTKHRSSEDMPVMEGGILKDKPSNVSTGNSKESLHVQFHKDIIEDCNDVGNPAHTRDILEVEDSPGSSRSSTNIVEDDEDSEFDGEDEEASLTEAQPPDGGYGWVVVVAAFATNMIADGITFSFGVIYVELLDYFHDGNGKTAWIGGLFMAMPLLCGPIASYLTDRFGCRKVCMFGGCMSAFGFIISAFANSIDVLIVTFGIISGMGLALCYVTAVVIVAFYFDKRRSLAMGLAVCGSGIGTVVFAPISNYLLSEYGWRGTTLLLAGVFLNMAVCGALMRDLDWTKARSKQQRKDRKAKNRERRSRNSLRTQTSSQASSALFLDSTYIEELKHLLEKGELPGNLLPEKLTKEPTGKQTTIAERNRFCSSLVNLPTFVRNGERVPFEVLELLSNNQQLYLTLLQNYPSLMISSHSFSDKGHLHELATTDGYKLHTESPIKLLDHNSLAAEVVIPHPGTQKEPLVVVDGKGKARCVPDHTAVQYSTHCKTERSLSSSDKSLNMCHLKGIRMHRNSMSYRGAMLNINKYRIRASSCPDIYKNSMITIVEDNEPYSWLWDVLDVFRDMVDVSLFADLQFLLFSVSNFLLYSWYHVPYVFLTDKAIAMGVDKVNAAYLISYLGILNMVGEVILGWAGDKSGINAGLVYAVCMTVCGISTLIMPFVSSYFGLASLAGIFGFSIAANYSLSSIILVELMSIDRFTSAYGLLLLVQGVANLIGPPVAGWLKDINGDYDMSFYLAGLFIIMCGILLLILPANKWLTKIKANRSITRVDHNDYFKNSSVAVQYI